jgi:hypothetical protein
MRAFEGVNVVIANEMIRKDNQFFFFSETGSSNVAQAGHKLGIYPGCP